MFAINFCERTFAAAWAQHFVVQSLVSTVSALGVFSGVGLGFRCLLPVLPFSLLLLLLGPARVSLLWAGLRLCKLRSPGLPLLHHGAPHEHSLFFPSLLPGSAPSSLALSLSLFLFLLHQRANGLVRFSGERRPG